MIILLMILLLTLDCYMLISIEEMKLLKDRRNDEYYKVHFGKIIDRAYGYFDGLYDLDVWNGSVDGNVWTFIPENVPSRTQYTYLRDAAFIYLFNKVNKLNVSLLNGYLEQIKNTLLNQVRNPKTDFSDRNYWNTVSYRISGPQDTVNWIRRIAFAYSFVKSDLNKNDQREIDHWLKDAAYFWTNNSIYWRSYRLEPGSDECYHFCPGIMVENPRYYGALPQYQFHGGWNNRHITIAPLLASVGVLVKDTYLKEFALKIIKEWIKYSTFPDGGVHDQHRWYINENVTNVRLGHAYPGVAIGSIASAADILARDGDTRAYDFETSEGKFGSEVVQGQGNRTKSLKNIIKHLLGQVNHTVIEYASSSETTDPKLIIDSVDEYNDNLTDTKDSYFAMANIYYNDEFIKDIYMRNAPNCPPKVPLDLPYAGGFDCYSGDWGSYPNVYFMYFEMEGKVWPYSLNEKDDDSEKDKFDIETLIIIVCSTLICIIVLILLLICIIFYKNKIIKLEVTNDLKGISNVDFIEDVELK